MKNARHLKEPSFGFGAALLFGASTPFAKAPLGAVDPWVMAGAALRARRDRIAGVPSDCWRWRPSPRHPEIRPAVAARRHSLWRRRWSRPADAWTRAHRRGHVIAGAHAWAHSGHNERPRPIAPQDVFCQLLACGGGSHAGTLQARPTCLLRRWFPFTICARRSGRLTHFRR